MGNLPIVGIGFGMAVFALAGTQAAPPPEACKQAAARKQPILVALDVRVDAHDEFRLVARPGEKAVFSVENRVYALLPTVVERAADRYSASEPNKAQLVSIKMTLPSLEEVQVTTPTGEAARVNAVRITPHLLVCRTPTADSK
jgi:hypothetical protein